MVFPSAVIWGITHKQDGSMKLHGDAGDSQILLNRERFFRSLGIDHEKIVSLNQTHEKNVVVVTRADEGRIIPDADGLITNQRGVILTIRVADCVPLYLYDPIQKSIGLVHSGWRGTVRNIAQAALLQMEKRYHSLPQHIIAFIGPHIQACHFEVQRNVANQFTHYPRAIVNKDGRIAVDLTEVIKQQLIEAGLNTSYISKSSECTFCLKDDYFSFRRDTPEKLEAMIAYIQIK